MALDPETGTLKWHYQFTPHDLHDWDANRNADARRRAVSRPAAQADAAGKPQRLLLRAGPADRQGAAGRTVRQEPDLGERHRSRRPSEAVARQRSDRGGPARLSRGRRGRELDVDGVQPVTQLFYLFADESCSIYTKNDKWWEAGKSFYGGTTRRAPGGAATSKSLKAIDVQTGKTAWEIPAVGSGILGSGLMATAGGLLFYGDGNGAFVAADAKNGSAALAFQRESAAGRPGR